jgi:hypothetical protein
MNITENTLTTDYVIKRLKMFRSVSYMRFGYNHVGTFYCYRHENEVWCMSEFSANTTERTFYPLSNFSTDEELEAVAVLLIQS